MDKFTATLPKDTTMKPREVRTILRRHRGAQAQLARELKVADGTVSRCIRDKDKSARIWNAAVKLAKDLLAQEQEAQHAA